MRPFVVDFETEAIQERPHHPPRPVGVSIKAPGLPPRYLAWGHPTGNNSTLEHARAVLLDIWRGPRAVIFHNAKFDLDVAETHLGLPSLPWDRVHDTMFLLFLKYPHSDTLSLKPMSEKILGMPPEERNAVRTWLVEHGLIPRNASDSTTGANISKCDGRVVGRYANGDTIRTIKLFDKLYPELDDKERAAYDRERRLLRILLENERQGIHFDVERAGGDIPVYESALQRADDWLRNRLGTPFLNLDADADVAEALDAAKVVTDWIWTKGGHGRPPQRSVAKGNLGIERFHDHQVFNVLGYRNRLHTVLSLNLRPWFAMAQANGGKIFTDWNQVKRTDMDGRKGARTGRLSCSRFQNIVKDFMDRGDGFTHPGLGLPDLPLARSYLLPDDGHVFCHRDYDQQEFRILAHYEDGDLLAQYVANPSTDYHTRVQALLKDLYSMDYGRRVVKTLNFGILYGMGVGLLAIRTGLAVDRAMALRQAVKGVTPGVANLDRELKQRGRDGKPIRTWGGRLYYCEPPAPDGRTYEYKLLNYLIQGSAADCTKEALIRYNEAKRDSRLLVTVHDEINITAPKHAYQQEMKILKDVMESIEFDVPMLTSGKLGPSWGDLEKET